MGEQTTQDLIDAGNLYEAWQSWNNEFGYFLTKMDCGYYYNIAICDFDPAEDNYEDFCNLPNPGDVYFSMINVFMESQMEDIASILNAGYKTLIYDGNFDIICNHSGVLDMIADMQWD